MIYHSLNWNNLYYLELLKDVYHKKNNYSKVYLLSRNCYYLTMTTMPLYHRTDQFIYNKWNMKNIITIFCPFWCRLFFYIKNTIVFSYFSFSSYFCRSLSIYTNISVLKGRKKNLFLFYDHEKQILQLLTIYKYVS
jgi:hypothetical protein